MSTAPLISILHPTARVHPYPPSFPRGCWGAVEQFANAAVKPHLIEYVLIVHESRWHEFWQEFGGETPGSDRARIMSSASDLYGSFFVVQNHGRDCVVDQINCGAAACSGQLMIGIMDDLEAPARWDARMLARMPQICRVCGAQFAPGEVMRCRCVIPAPEPHLDGEYVIDLTGEPTEWIVYSALTRKRYERYGYVLHPEFESMYADNYYSHVAHKDGVVISGRHLGFKHNHPINGRMALDEIYELQNRPEAYAEGRRLLSKLISGRQLLAVVMPGEEFSNAWVSNAFDLQWNLAMHYDLQPFMGFSSMVHATRYDLHNQVLDAKPKPDLVLWFDDDNTPSYAHVERLLRDLEERPDIDGIVAWCWCDNKKGGATKPEDWTMSVGKLSAEDDFGGHEGLRFTRQEMAMLGPIITAREIQAKYGEQCGFWSGFPCVLLRYSTCERMGRDCFAPILHPKAHRGFTGEDTAFFWRARKYGVNMAVDLRVKVPHLKFGAFEPDFVPESVSASPEKASAAVPVLV